MAFSLGERFPPPPPPDRSSDPGAYQYIGGTTVKSSKIPFLSTTPRSKKLGNPLYTHAIYNTDIRARIVNPTSLQSKCPRFPYEALTQEDIDKILCQCGVQTTCECLSSEQDEEEIICQAKVPKRIFKGATPGHVKEPKKPIKSEEKVSGPPFYDARVIEATAYYHGCKWGRTTSKRSSKLVDSGPGPAAYTIVSEPRPEHICAEKVRAHKRKTSKQLRYIEMVQERNFRDNFPGPASYDPKKLKGTEMSHLGPKAERFPLSAYEQRPGPADHWLKRCFDPLEIPDVPCKAKLVDRAPFGVRAVRLKHKHGDGPSPASYDVKSNMCKQMRCSKAPFGTSAIRFRETVNDEDDIDIDELAEDVTVCEKQENKECKLPTWVFKSKTIRMKPLCKKWDEPSPADLPQSRIKVTRSPRLQTLSPFFSSEDRFRPWRNWIAVQGLQKIPGPCYYSLEKYKCYPAVPVGPLFRSPRFSRAVPFQTPSPYQYNIRTGTDIVLATHNERLRKNVKNRRSFAWIPKEEPRFLTYEERERLLLAQSIELLNV